MCVWGGGIPMHANCASPMCIELLFVTVKNVQSQLGLTCFHTGDYPILVSSVISYHQSLTSLIHHLLPFFPPPLLPTPPQIPFCLRWSSSSSSSLSSTRQSAPVPARLRWLSGTTCLLQSADQGSCLRQGTASVEMWSCSRATSCMDVEAMVSVERCFLCGGRGTGLCKEVVL